MWQFCVSSKKDKETEKNLRKEHFCELNKKRVEEWTASSTYSGSKPLRSSRVLIVGTRQIMLSFLTAMDGRLLTTAQRSRQTTWSRRSGTKVRLHVDVFTIENLSSFSADRILDKLHEHSSSPQSVPSAKSPQQENCNSAPSRWKRNSPDPNKMMMGRSPLDVNAKRILSSTPNRRASNQNERVGSPSLSGYPVRIHGFWPL